ncbi:unnamed protein product, partial [Ectocarpus sp. 12 AP-2014]
PYSAYLYSKHLLPRRTASSGSRHASTPTKYKPSKNSLLNILLSKPTARLGTTHLSSCRLQQCTSNQILVVKFSYTCYTKNDFNFSPIFSISLPFYSSLTAVPPSFVFTPKSRPSHVQRTQRAYVCATQFWRSRLNSQARTRRETINTHIRPPSRMHACVCARCV